MDRLRAYFVGIIVIAAILFAGAMVRELKLSMGAYADPVIFLFVGLAVAAAGPIVSRVFPPPSKLANASGSVVLGIVLIAFILSGAFTGCDPGGRRSSGKFGGDSFFECAVGGVLGLFVGFLAMVLFDALGGVKGKVGTDEPAPAPLGRAITLAVVSVAFVGALGWRLLRASETTARAPVAAPTSTSPETTPKTNGASWTR